jgi:protease I
MASELKGKRIAFLVAQEGVEEVELTKPWEAVKQAGATPELIAPKEGEVQAMNHLDKSSEGKPVGVICHGPWTLVEADLVRDRTITSWPSLKTDIRNAGGNWVDEEVVVDEGLVSSRKPDDLPAFCAKIVEEFAEGEHEVAAAGATAGAHS